jgi:hypothetical protein
LKQAVEEAGAELALIENPGGHTSCPHRGNSRVRVEQIAYGQRSL